MSERHTSTLPEGWVELRTGSGLQYFRHIASNTTSWDRPSFVQSSQFPELKVPKPRLPVSEMTVDFERASLSPASIKSRSDNPFRPIKLNDDAKLLGITNSRSLSTPVTESIPQYLKPREPMMSPRIPAKPENLRLSHRPRDLSLTQPVHKPEYIIGIDFGTTFTSCCYYKRVARLDSTSNVDLIQFNQWIGHTTSLDALPSQMLYDGNAPINWGHLLETDRLSRPNSMIVKWFKLHLKTSSDLLSQPYAQGLQTARSSYPLPPGCTAVKVISDFLTRVRRSIIEVLEKYEKNQTRFQDYAISYVLTLPAIWNLQERKGMEEAAIAAGFRNASKSTDFVFVTEPEAAAFGVWSARDMHDPDVGESFLVCDAGGGTVDLVSYKVKSKNPVVFEELVGPSGGLCGSSYLDLRFEALLRRRFGPHNETLFGTLGQQTNSQRKFLAYYTESFHEFKQSFSYSDPQRRDFLCTGDVSGRERQLRELGMRDGNLCFDANYIQDEVFIPVIDQIRCLVVEQIDRAAQIGHKTIDYIYLVGGFGRSPFLHQYLQSKLENSTIRIPRVPDAQLAISKGAVMSKLAAYNVGPIGALAGRRLTHSFAHEFDRPDVGAAAIGRHRTINLAGRSVITGNLDYLAVKGGLYTEGQQFRSSEEFRYLLSATEYNSWTWIRSKQLMSCATYNRPEWRDQSSAGTLSAFCNLRFSSQEVSRDLVTHVEASTETTEHAMLIFRLKMSIKDNNLTFSMLIGDTEVSIKAMIYSQNTGLEIE